MKATCPNCSTSYKVADDKVPDLGAQIKCPKCQTTFVVKPLTLPPPPAVNVDAAVAPTASAPPAASTSAAPPPPSPAAPTSSTPPPPPAATEQAAAPEPAAASLHEQSTPLHELMGTAAPKSQTPNLDALDGEAEITSSPKPLRASEETRQAARGMSAIRAQSATKKPISLEGYRVRTGRGLTYDFPTREAMVRWLSERDEIDDCEASAPGGEWMPAADMLAQAPSGPDRPEKRELDAVDPSRPLEVVAGPQALELPDREASRRAIRDAYRGPRAGVVLWLVLALMFLLTAAAGAVTLTRYGVFDLTGILPLDQVGIVFPGEDAGKAGRGVDDAPVVPAVRDVEASFRQAINAGRRSLKAKRFSRAALEFNRALSIHPGSVEALEGLAQAFVGLGDKQRAEEALKRAQEITH